MAIPTWISAVQAISAPFIAIGAAAIAVFGALINRRQAHTARQKLRLDLFSLRYAIYSTTVDAMVSAINAQGDVPTFDSSTRQLHLKVREASFLFDEPFFAYLNSIETRILQNRHWAGLVCRRINAADRKYKTYLEEYTVGQQWLIDNLTTLAIKAASFLKVEESSSFSLKRPDAGVKGQETTPAPET